MLSNHTAIERVVTSLESLFVLFPPEEVLIIGNRSIEWVKYAQTFPTKTIHYIDAESKSLSRMKRLYNDQKLHYYHVLIAGQEGEVAYYRYSYSALNSTLPLTVFKPYWANITLRKTKQKMATTLPAYLKSHELKPNYLILDTLSGHEILSSCDTQTLAIFDVIILATLPSLEQYLPLEAVGILEDNLFILFQTIVYAHPELQMVIYVKDYRKQLLQKPGRSTKCAKQVKKLEKELREIQGYINKAKEAYEKKIAEFSYEINEYEGFKQQVIEQESKLQEKLRSEEEGVKTIEKKYDNLIYFIHNQEKHLIDLHNKIENNTKNIKNYIATKSTITAYEIESFLNINNYLFYQKLPLNFHGWPVSPDIALYLIEKIEEQLYDLTIEFGSGTSTFLFTEINKMKKFQTKHLAFEHNEHYYQKTLNNLRNRGLDKYVNLVYAPLKSLKYKEYEFNYYDCNVYLKEAATKKPKKILVLVDGPPGDTNYLARLPAILFLLENFCDCEIHFILDDYYREEEKKTVQIWEEILEEKNIKFKKEIEKNEKGLCSLFFNLTSSKKEEDE